VKKDCGHAHPSAGTTERASALESTQTPDWEVLTQDWPNGHLKLAWTRSLLRLRTGLADVFAHGDYQPLEVSGPHRDHIIAFARRRGRDAVITAVAKSFAPFTRSGRAWPRGEAFDATINVGGYFFDGIGEGDAGDLRAASLFRHLPAAVLKARFEGVLKPKRKRVLA